jgi:hypothetical protein
VGGTCRAYALGEEFTDFVLVDDVRDSIIINIKKDFFSTIYREYKKLGYKLVHLTKFKDGEQMTLVFVKV